MSTQIQNRPTAAYILTLIGGIFGLIGSISVIAVGFFVSSFSLDYYGLAGFPFWFFAGWGIWVLICSALLIFFATKLNAEPMEHSKWGILILVFGIIGTSNLLAIIGGILALIYKPIPYGAAPTYQQPYGQPPPPPTYAQPVQPHSTTRFCPNCGRMVNENTKFCPYCGKQLS